MEEKAGTFACFLCECCCLSRRGFEFLGVAFDNLGRDKPMESWLSYLLPSGLPVTLVPTAGNLLHTSGPPGLFVQVNGNIYIYIVFVIDPSK